MRHACLIAVSVVNPAWHYDARTVDEVVVVSYYAAVIRPYWRRATRWLGLAVLFVF